VGETGRRARLTVSLLALVAATLITIRTGPPTEAGGSGVQLRSTDAPMSDVITTTNPKPFDPCNDIPLDVIAGLGLEASPPTPMESWRCQYDAGSYQMAVEPVIWRTYAQSLFFSPVYSNPDVDCMQENLMRAQQLTPFYIF
jgi:hypothetical protein